MKYQFSIGDTFPGTEDDDNGGSMSTAGINVGEHGNRIELYGSAELNEPIEVGVERAEALRDYVLRALKVYDTTTVKAIKL